ncbi:MAG: hypothetical protein NTU79_11680 [Planctomycetota bacterium]|nr:hypothetical protein [Planctomycetota bacterium]
MLVQNKESKPAAVQIKLEYAKAYEKTPGQNSVSIMAPQAPLNQWRIRIPDPGVKVQVEPMLATTEATKAPEGEAPGGTEPNASPMATMQVTPASMLHWKCEENLITFPRREGWHRCPFREYRSRSCGEARSCLPSWRF